MEDTLKDSHGPVFDANALEDVAEHIGVYLDFSNTEVIEALEGLNRVMKQLCNDGELANRALLAMNPLLVSIKTDPDWMPRKLKKSYWKIFENRRLTWRERNRLARWCKNGNTTLDKLSGKQADAKTSVKEDNQA